eukprot:XP_019076167.1 PREDICTED: uncharacterized protein LOC109122803 [Vitis vinifera]
MSWAQVGVSLRSPWTVCFGLRGPKPRRVIMGQAKAFKEKCGLEVASAHSLNAVSGLPLLSKEARALAKPFIDGDWRAKEVLAIGTKCFEGMEASQLEFTIEALLVEASKYPTSLSQPLFFGITGPLFFYSFLANR